MTDLGEPKKFLGIEIMRKEDGTMLINQQKFTENVLKQFGMNDAKTKRDMTQMKTNDVAKRVDLQKEVENL